MSNPRFVDEIRAGRFESAQDSLVDAAAQRIVPQLTQAYWHTQVQGAIEKMNNDSPYSRWTKGEAEAKAVERINRLVSQGQQVTPQTIVDEYHSSLTEADRQFKTQARPGYMRSESEPYTPADQEIRDYLADRRAQQQHLKDEGRKISLTNTK